MVPNKFPSISLKRGIQPVNSIITKTTCNNKKAKIGSNHCFFISFIKTPPKGIFKTLSFHKFELIITRIECT